MTALPPDGMSQKCNYIRIYERKVIVKYMLLIDVQDSVVAPIHAEHTARRICKCALAVKDRPGVFVAATRLAEADDAAPELYGCLGGVVSSRPVRYGTATRFPTLIARIASDGGKPEEIAIGGFLTSTSVLKAALAFRDLYPECKVTILEDLCADRSSKEHDAAISVAESNGISVETSAMNLAIPTEETNAEQP